MLVKIQKHKFLVFILLIGLIYFLRIIYLDQDLPPWGIGYYQPVDEGPYSLMALNYTHYGNINPTEIPGTVYATSTLLQTRTNIVGNLLCIVGLELLGNNYYGLRFGYVLLGIANLGLFILILHKIGKESFAERNTIKLLVIFSFLLLFDFMFYLSSRIVENSSVRLFFNLLVTYIWIAKKKNYKSRFFLISGIAVLSVFMVYITNIFCILAIFLCIINIFIYEDKKDALCAMGYSCMGGIIALIIAELYYYIIWDSSLIEAFFGVIQLFSQSDGYTITGTSGNIFVVVLKKFLAYWGSNSLIYNLPIVFVVFAMLPVIIKHFIFRVDENITLISFMILSFMLQTLFVEDCIGRKIIAIYPLFLGLVYYLLINREKISEIFNKWGKKTRFFYVIYLMLALCLCAMVVYYRLYRPTDRTNLDIDTLTRWTILIGCGLSGLTFLFLVLRVCEFKRLKLFKVLVCINIVGLLVINTSLIYRFCIKDVTFYERDAMRELDRYISEEDVFVVGGGYQLSYSLYNEMKYIIVEDLAEIQPLMESNEDILLIDYEWDSGGMDYYFNNVIFPEASSTVEPIYIIQRNFMAYGQKRNFCLYKIKHLEPIN